MPQPLLPGLYAVTPDESSTPRLVAMVQAAVAGGAPLVQYRNKIASPALQREQVAALLPVCRAAGARLIVNDNIALALELVADGVHVGRDDAPGASLEQALAAARQALGPQRLLGVSCYNEESRAAAAANAGADYLAFGSMFASPTKPAANRAPLELLTTAKRRFGLPVAAIGGITLSTAPQLLAAGADLLAVISDLFTAEDIEKRAQDFAALWIAQDGAR